MYKAILVFIVQLLAIGLFPCEAATQPATTPSNSQPCFEADVLLHGPLGPPWHIRVWRLGERAYVEDYKSSHYLTVAFFFDLSKKTLWNYLPYSHSVLLRSHIYRLFWEEVQRKGLERTLQENHISPKWLPTLKKTITSYKTLDQAIFNSLQMNYMGMPFLVSAAEVKKWGKPVGQEKVAGIPCLVYQLPPKRYKDGTTIQGRVWVDPHTHLELRVETVENASPNSSRPPLRMGSEVSSIKFSRDSVAAHVLFPPGTVVHLPKKVLEAYPYLAKVPPGVKLDVQPGYGDLFSSPPP